MKSNTLKKFLKENATGDNLRYTKSEKRAFLEACRQYGNYKESFVKSEEIRQKVEEIGWLVDTAENIRTNYRQWNKTLNVDFDLIVNETDREIKMPEGVSYKGLDTAPAWAIIEQHHLEAWL